MVRRGLAIPGLVSFPPDRSCQRQTERKVMKSNTARTAAKMFLFFMMMMNSDVFMMVMNSDVFFREEFDEANLSFQNAD